MIPPATDLNYQLVRSRRKTLSLIVHEDQTLEVRSPLHVPVSQIEQFITDKAGWIARKRRESGQAVRVGPLSPARRQEAVQVLREQFENASLAFNGPRPKRLLIRDLSSRWGSCSTRGTISLNSRALVLPRSLREYLIYHELCHLIQMNHSPSFWQQLERYVPQAKKKSRQLNCQYRLQGRSGQME